MDTEKESSRAVSPEGGKRVAKKGEGGGGGRCAEGRESFFLFFRRPTTTCWCIWVCPARRKTFQALAASLSAPFIRFDTAPMVHCCRRKRRSWTRGGKKERASGNEGRRSWLPLLRKGKKTSPHQRVLALSGPPSRRLVSPKAPGTPRGELAGPVGLVRGGGGALGEGGTGRPFAMPLLSSVSKGEAKDEK